MWNERRKLVVDASDMEYLNRAPQIGPSFYVSSYACPMCGKAMYKTVFPVGCEYPISISNGKVAEMKRVFTCPECRYFATAAVSKLSDGVIYELHCATSDEYKATFNAMELSGTTRGRRD